MNDRLLTKFIGKMRMSEEQKKQTFFLYTVGTVFSCYMCDQGNSREAEKKAIYSTFICFRSEMLGNYLCPLPRMAHGSPLVPPPPPPHVPFPTLSFLKKHISWREVHIYYPVKEEEEEGEPGNTASPGGAETVEF